MPVRHAQRQAKLTQQVIPLLLLGMGLITTNNSVTFIDDESTILGAAASPLRTMLALVFFRRWQHTSILRCMTSFSTSG